MIANSEKKDGSTNTEIMGGSDAGTSMIDNAGEMENVDQARTIL